MRNVLLIFLIGLSVSLSVTTWRMMRETRDYYHVRVRYAEAMMAALLHQTRGRVLCAECGTVMQPGQVLRLVKRGESSRVVHATCAPPMGPPMDGTPPRKWWTWPYRWR